MSSKKPKELNAYQKYYNEQKKQGFDKKTIDLQWRTLNPKKKKPKYSKTFQEFQQEHKGKDNKEIGILWGKFKQNEEQKRPVLTEDSDLGDVSEAPIKRKRKVVKMIPKDLSKIPKEFKNKTEFENEISRLLFNTVKDLKHNGIPYTEDEHKEIFNRYTKGLGTNLLHAYYSLKKFNGLKDRKLFNNELLTDINKMKETNQLENLTTEKKIEYDNQFDTKTKNLNELIGRVAGQLAPPWNKLFVDEWVRLTEDYTPTNNEIIEMIDNYIDNVLDVEKLKLTDINAKNIHDYITEFEYSNGLITDTEREKRDNEPLEKIDRYRFIETHKLNKKLESMITKKPAEIEPETEAEISEDSGPEDEYQYQYQYADDTQDETDYDFDKGDLSGYETEIINIPRTSNVVIDEPIETETEYRPPLETKEIEEKEQFETLPQPAPTAERLLRPDDRKLNSLVSEVEPLRKEQKHSTPSEFRSISLKPPPPSSLSLSGHRTLSRPNIVADYGKQVFPLILPEGQPPKIELAPRQEAPRQEEVQTNILRRLLGLETKKDEDEIRNKLFGVKTQEDTSKNTLAQILAHLAGKETPKTDYIKKEKEIKPTTTTFNISTQRQRQDPQKKPRQIKDVKFKIEDAKKKQYLGRKVPVKGVRKVISTKPKTASSWNTALKKWNNMYNKGKWKIPKKGTAEHQQVVKIQSQG